MAEEVRVRPGPENDSSKLLAALGYPLWIVAVLALLLEPYKDEEFVRFHAVQAIGLTLTLLVAGVVLGTAYAILLFIPFVGIFCAFMMFPVFIVFPLAFIYQIILAFQAYSGEYVQVPVVKDLVRQYSGD